MNVIETHALGKSYGSTKALDDCTLSVPDGHVVALVGPNGAGKSTLLNLVVGLERPTTGGVTVLGGHPAGSLPALDAVAFVAQGTPQAVQPVTARDQQDYLSAAACMRSHGVTNFPDPTFSGSTVNFHIPAGMNAHSKQFAQARRTCERLIPEGLPKSESSG
jgi:ABC-type branched-subunit amino acid transport system ATPase component